MKYKLTDETITICDGTVLHRIERLSDGEKGGFIESEGNLNQYGKAWVSGDAQVYGKAQVYGDAWVSGDARVYGDARVSNSMAVALQCLI